MSVQEVDNYLSSAPEPHRSTLASLRRTIAALLPDAEQCISYGVPTFKVDGKAVAGFGYYSMHCAYFPMSGSITSAIADELGEYTTTKGSVHFAIDKPLPSGIVTSLISARLTELAGQPRGPAPRRFSY
jgi:uncharacterized protein YdhG (YjbR/CyaY superfamily)